MIPPFTFIDLDKLAQFTPASVYLLKILHGGKWLTAIDLLSPPFVP